MEQVDGALGPAQFDPGGRSLDLDVSRCAVAPRSLVCVLLATLGQLGCGVQRPLTGISSPASAYPTASCCSATARPRLVSRLPCCNAHWASPMVRGASRVAAAWSALRTST